MTDTASSSGRLRIEGNALVLTAQFDPRYQRSAETELLRTLQGMLDEKTGDTFVLDMKNLRTLPSMLFGCIAEAHRRALEKGSTLILHIKPDHLRSIDSAGLRTIFDREKTLTDKAGVSFVELISEHES